MTDLLTVLYNLVFLVALPYVHDAASDRVCLRGRQRVVGRAIDEVVPDRAVLCSIPVHVPAGLLDHQHHVLEALFAHDLLRYHHPRCCNHHIGSRSVQHGAQFAGVLAGWNEDRCEIIECGSYIVSLSGMLAV